MPTDHTTEPGSERRRQIVRAARTVFAERGFGRTTIKQIAEQADLKSPALIYWYFASKEDLFDAVCSEVTPVVEQAGDFSALMDRPPEEVLAHLARTYFTVIQRPEAAQHFRIFLAEAAREGGAEQFSSKEFNQVLEFVTAYLQHQVDAGRLRPHDVGVSARAFLGLLLVYVLGMHDIHPVGMGLPHEDQYIDEVVGMLLKGLDAQGAPSADQ